MAERLKKILIVDSDKNICEIMNMYLQSSGYTTQILYDDKMVIDLLKKYEPDLILLDIMLPHVNGIDILKMIRKEKDVPVIIVTSKNDTFDKVLALNLGADDYIVKPFDPKELLARINAVMRRYSKNESNMEYILEFNDLKINANSYTVQYGDKNVKMPPKEFELLYYLAKNKNQVFTREELLCKVWGYDYPGDSRTVDVHIKRLRSKIKGRENWSIETVWGIGYKFEVKYM